MNHDDENMIWDENDIAVIGMSGCFPGAPDMETYWHNLERGVESIVRLTDEQILDGGEEDPAALGEPRYIKATPLLDLAGWFDAYYFGYSPREAERMDPQFRLFMEIAVQAMEHAGLDPERTKRPIGVYAGAAGNDYYVRNLAPNPAVVDSKGDFQVMYSNHNDFLATSLAYKFDLRGPALSVQTFCSSTLVAVHLSCQALLDRECDIALAGGVAVRVPHVAGYWHQEGGILSSDGHVRTFDAGADGTVFGSGAGAFVLKRMEDAVREGDHVYAIVRGSAINNDGANKAGYTAPSLEGQAGVIVQAMAAAGVSPDSISYVEAHGTGTYLGDPIEVAALTRAYRTRTQRLNYCAIGSVKTNIGHLNAASGAASLIKTILALQHETIPPTINFHTPNPVIDFAGSPFYVAAKPIAWPRTAAPRRAGISSLGFGGTNAHVIVEEAPVLPPTTRSRSHSLVVLSAKTHNALQTMAGRLARALRARPGLEIDDVAYTLQTGRREFNRRLAVVGSSCEDLAAALSRPDSGKLDSGRVLAGNQDTRAPQVVFLLPGQGTQHVDMARGLYREEPRFRAWFDRCADGARAHINMDMRALVYPRDDRARAEAETRIHHTAITQPLLFAIEYALAMMWIEWGIAPASMLGHSLGDLVAACISGVFSLDDALALVCARGRLMGDMPPGAMLAVPRSHTWVTPLLPADIDIAAINAPDKCVVAGPVVAIDAFAADLASRGVDSHRLDTSHAFHSAMMEPAANALLQVLRPMTLNAPETPFVSSMSGAEVTAEEARDPRFWAEQIRAPIRFDTALARVLEIQGQVLLEVGPGRTLTGLARAALGQRSDTALVSSLRHPRQNVADLAFVLETLGRLWLAGARVDWDALHANTRRRKVALPSYPFERRRYWIHALRSGDSGNARGDARVNDGHGSGQADGLFRSAEPKDWLYQPIWHQVNQVPGVAPDEPETWLVVASPSPICRRVIEALGERGHRVVSVEPGPAWARMEAQRFAIRPGSADDHDALLAVLIADEMWPDRVLHLGNMDDTRTIDRQPHKDPIAGVSSPLLLARALARYDRRSSMAFFLVTTRAVRVTGAEDADPAAAAVLGAMAVIPRELDQVRCRVVDVTPPPGNASAWQANRGFAKRWIDALLDALFLPWKGRVLAIRGTQWWQPRAEHIARPVAPGRMESAQPGQPEAGTWLIAGGVSGPGLDVAEQLARTPGQRLLLVGGPEFPAAETWSDWLDAQPPDEQHARAIRRIQAMQASGALVHGFPVQSGAALAETLALHRAAWGPLHGVIYTGAAIRRASFEVLAELNEARIEQAFKSCLQELDHLSVGLADEQPAVCLLITSMTAVLGGAGFAVAAAVAGYLDAWAHVQRRTGHLPWTAIAWDARAEDARAEAAGNTGELSAMALTPEDEVRLLDCVRDVDLPGTVWISTVDLNERLARWPGVPREREDSNDTSFVTSAVPGEPADPTRVHPRPDLPAAWVGPRDEREERLVRIWESLFRIQGLGVNDSFFDLGGHSLLATQLASHISEAFDVDIPLSRLFEEPTIAGQATLIRAALPEQKPSRQRTSILPRDPARPAPLSWSQQRLWFIDRLERDRIERDRLQGGLNAYNEPRSVRMDGPLNVHALAQSIDLLVKRHEILRTTFPVQDGAAVQRVAPPGPWHLPLIDLTHLDPAARERTAQALVDADLLRPFDLDQGPLWRCALIRLDAGSHVLMRTVHHLITDGWSTELFNRELFTLYSALGQGQPSPLEPLRIQYADFAAWQRENHTPEAMQSELNYWLHQLRDLPDELALPTDRPRPREQTWNGAAHNFSVAPATVAAVHRLAQADNATPFMVYLATFAVLLARYTGQHDVPIGSPIANRNRHDVEPLIGIFVNTLVLRVRLDGDPGFRELLRRVRAMTMDAYAHQDIPFSHLVDALKPTRNLSRGPLFQVMFVLHKPAVERFEVEGITVSRFAAARVNARFDLNLVMEQTDKGVQARFEYNTDLFDEVTVVRLARHYLTLLAQVIQDPEKAVSRLGLLAGHERADLLENWGQSVPARQPGGLVHEQFEHAARDMPDAQCVVCDGQTWSYGAFDALANRLARRLVKLGVKAEDRIGVLAERSWETVLAMLAIFKAGGAYVPIDLQQPAPRINAVMRAGEVGVLIAARPVPEGLDAENTIIVSLAPDLDQLDDDDGDRPALPAAIKPEHLAYVIFTSGSTGTPKGVCIEHRHISAYVDALFEFCHIEPRSRFAMVSTPAADLGHTSLFGALCSGGALHILTRDQATDPLAFTAYMTRERIDYLKIVPSHLAALLANDVVLPARALILGGEATRTDWLASVLPAQRKCTVYNHYGPSETTVGVMAWALEPSDPVPAAATLPLGPLPGNRIYLLDEHRQPVPAGVVGEIYVGGRQVGRGYLENPGATAERFIDDPFAGQAGARMYRTGDMARYRADGTLEFLGRGDDQIKIRGYRVEPREVQVVLEKHPQVRSAVVIPQRWATGEVRMIAYVVADRSTRQSDDGAFAQTMFAYLGERLPAYLVPADMVLVDALPLNANGKLDRSALPVPDPSASGLSGKRYLPPQTATERLLARLWADTLGVDRVGSNDNFFARGGDSLASIQLVARAQRAGIELSVRQIFQHQTLAQLAAAMDHGAVVAGQDDAFPAIERIAPDLDKALSYVQQRVRFMAGRPGEQTAYQRLATLEHLRGPLHIDHLATSLSDVVGSHEILRTVFPLVEGRAVQRVMPAAPVAIEVVDVADSANMEERAGISGQSMLDAIEPHVQRLLETPMDLERGPLMRAAVLRFGHDSHVLCLVLHDLITDVTSIGALNHELARLYDARVRGAPVEDLLEHSNVEVQYGDFAHWQRRHLIPQKLAERHRYWREQLAGAPLRIALPADRPAPLEQDFRGRRQMFAIDAPVARALADLGQTSCGATLFMTLQAAFAAFLTRWSGQDDICVGVPMANRNRKELRGTMGPLINPVVVRTRWPGDCRFIDGLRHTRDAAVQAFVNEVPFESLVESMEITRSKAYTPLFQVLFTFHGGDGGGLTLAGLESRPLVRASYPAKYDLTLAMWRDLSGLAGFFGYPLSLFDDPTIALAIGRFERVIQAIISHPDIQICDLPW